VRRIDGTSSARTGKEGVVTIESAPVSTGSAPKVTNAGEYRFFAGVRTDPFFFRAMGALHNLQFTGQDFFADKNVASVEPNRRW
jgi:hypothetical protein